MQPSHEPLSFLSCLRVVSQHHEQQELLPQVQLQVLLVWLLQPSELEGEASCLISYSLHGNISIISDHLPSQDCQVKAREHTVYIPNIQNI